MDSTTINKVMDPSISSGLDLAYFALLLVVFLILGVLAIVYVVRPYFLAKVGGSGDPVVEKIDRALRSLDRASDETRVLKETFISLKNDYQQIRLEVDQHDARIQNLDTNYAVLRNELIAVRDEFRAVMDRARDDTAQSLNRVHSRIDTLLVREGV